MLIQKTSLYSRFLQKFGLWLSDVKPSRTLNVAFYFSFPNTLKMFLCHEYKFPEKISPLTSVRKTDVRRQKDRQQYSRCNQSLVLKYFFLNLGEGKIHENDHRDFRNLPLPCWFSINNSETVKPVILVSCRIQ